jgi:recombinase
LVFETFVPRRAASPGLEFFTASGLRLPRRDRFGAVVWQRPTIAARRTMLKPPAYAGTLPSGRTRPLRPGRAAGGAATKRRAMEPWRMRVPDKDPAYIRWAPFAQSQTILRDTHAEYERHQTRGIPRPGKALLHGLGYGGAGGPKMVGQSQGGTASLCTSCRPQ